MAEKARTLFAEKFGAQPEAIAFAPGRVNLIGEHVDYNDGLVLPMPIDAGTAVAWARSDDGRIHVHAADLGEGDSFEPDAPTKPGEVSWRSYVRGMAAQWDGELPALSLLITGDLPRGSGLSSSASLCIALARAFAAATGTEIDPTSLARQAQRTEHEFAGVACGIMDQMAIAAGKPEHAMLLDCRDLSYEHFAIPSDWAVLIVDSGVTRGLVDGEYNARRQQCEAAARALGVDSLRDVRMEKLVAAALPQLEARRATHVVGEIARVREAAKALQTGDLARFGTLLQEGHASLRDLFEVSHPVVDELVERLQGKVGASGGARMTGAGFGGSVVVVLPESRAAEIDGAGDGKVLRVT
nr:galactokinase [Qipengyuania sphaerica]